MIVGTVVLRIRPCLSLVSESYSCQILVVIVCMVVKS